MAIVGSIVIGMIAQTDKFLGPLAQAQKALTSFGRGIGSYLAGPVGRVEHLVGGAIEGVKNLFESIDKTGDAADRIGVTTAALSEMRYAAKLTGTETEAMDTALTKFSANLGEAVNSEITPAAKALKSIGLDPKKLATQDITKSIVDISDAMQGMGNEAQKNALLKTLFGKGGIQIANTMNAGGDAIRKFTAEFQGMGGAISETQRQQVAVMNDTLDKAGATLVGIGTQVAVGLSPYLDAAIEQFLGLAAGGEEASTTVSKFMDGLIDGVAGFLDFAQTINNAFMGIQFIASKAWVAIVDGAAWTVRGLDYLLESTTGFTTGLGETITKFAKDFSDASQGIQDDLRKQAADQEAWGEKFKKNADTAVAKSKAKADAAAQANKKEKKAIEELTITQDASDKAALKATADWASRAKGIFDEVQTPLEKYQDKLEAIRSSLAGGAIDPTIANRAIAKARDEFEGPQKFAGALEAGSSEARSAILQAISGRGSKEDATAKNTGDMAATLKRIEDLQRKATASQPNEELSMY
jgi:hypothetical protein